MVKIEKNLYIKKGICKIHMTLHVNKEDEENVHKTVDADWGERKVWRCNVKEGISYHSNLLHWECIGSGYSHNDSFCPRLCQVISSTALLCTSILHQCLGRAQSTVGSNVEIYDKVLNSYCRINCYSEVDTREEGILTLNWEVGGEMERETLCTASPSFLFFPGLCPLGSFSLIGGWGTLNSCWVGWRWNTRLHSN